MKQEEQPIQHFAHCKKYFGLDTKKTSESNIFCDSLINVFYMHDELNTCDRPSFLLSLSLLYLLHMGRDKCTEMWRLTDRHQNAFNYTKGMLLHSNVTIFHSLHYLFLCHRSHYGNVSTAELYRGLRGGTKCEKNGF